MRFFKIMIVASMAMLFASDNLSSQVIVEDQSPTATGSSASETSGVVSQDWRVTHQQRVKTNQQIAHDLRQSSDLSQPKHIQAILIKAARQLPSTSFHREQMKTIAAKLSSAGEKPSLDDAMSRIGQIAADLAFKPTLETELPQDFPAPTPVGEIEIKFYPAYRMVRTEVDGHAGEQNDRAAFLRLFNHIEKNEIAMTSPVEMIYESTESGFEERSMAFLFPNQQTGKPEELGDVEVTDAAPAKVIAMGVRGRPDHEKVKQVADQLVARSLKYAAGFELASSVRLMAYNGPSVPEKDQFYEIQIKLTKKLKKVIFVGQSEPRQ